MEVLSGVPRVVLTPLIILIYVNDVHDAIR